MYRFIESIKIRKGKAELINYHQKRYNDCMNIFYPDCKKYDLNLIVKNYSNKKSIHKLRIVYDCEIREVECKPYSIRQHNYFHLRHSDNIDYAYKYLNRENLMELKHGIDENDEIIIVKNACITDSSYSNIAFRKNNKWFTPDNPLLNGTRRQKLIDDNILHPLPIKVEDIEKFEYFCLINSMMDLDETLKHSIKKIKY